MNLFRKEYPMRMYLIRVIFRGGKQLEFHLKACSPAHAEEMVRNGFDEVDEVNRIQVCASREEVA